MRITEKLWSEGPGKITVCVDGCARGNPGHAGCGLVVKDSEDRVLVRKARYIGVTTNNVAEYTATIDGLREAVDIGAGEVTVLTDSELVVRQMTGEYRVKDVKLRELFGEAQRLSRSFSCSKFVHVERNNNREADSLANEAVDSFLKTGRAGAGQDKQQRAGTSNGERPPEKGPSFDTRHGATGDGSDADPAHKTDAREAAGDK